MKGAGGPTKGDAVWDVGVPPGTTRTVVRVLDARVWGGGRPGKVHGRRFVARAKQRMGSGWWTPWEGPRSNVWGKSQTAEGLWVAGARRKVSRKMFCESVERRINRVNEALEVRG